MSTSQRALWITPLRAPARAPEVLRCGHGRSRRPDDAHHRDGPEHRRSARAGSSRLPGHLRPAGPLGRDRAGATRHVRECPAGDQPAHSVRGGAGQLPRLAALGLGRLRGPDPEPGRDRFRHPRHGSAGASTVPVRGARSELDPPHRSGRAQDPGRRAALRLGVLPGGGSRGPRSGRPDRAVPPRRATACVGVGVRAAGAVQHQRPPGAVAGGPRQPGQTPGRAASGACRHCCAGTGSPAGWRTSRW